MIDFQNASFVKLREVKPDKFLRTITPILVPGEEIIAAYQSVRDHVVFTNKRLITVNVQGITGKKQDYSSLPYRSVQAFSVETSGVLDLDCELQLYFSGLGKITLEFLGSDDIAKICRMIGEYALR